MDYVLPVLVLFFLYMFEMNVMMKLIIQNIMFSITVLLCYIVSNMMQ